MVMKMVIVMMIYSDNGDKVIDSDDGDDYYELEEYDGEDSD